MSALDRQVGGGHYREGAIQPVQYIEANSLRFLEGCVVKRVTRHDREGGKGRLDIEKAIHELQLLLELRYPEPAQQAVYADPGPSFEAAIRGLDKYAGHPKAAPSWQANPRCVQCLRPVNECKCGYTPKQGDPHDPYSRR